MAGRPSAGRLTPGLVWLEKLPVKAGNWSVSGPLPQIAVNPNGTTEVIKMADYPSCAAPREGLSFRFVPGQLR